MPETTTDLERGVLDWIIEYVQRNTYPPTVREIGDALSIPSTRSVSDLLKALERKGWIERTPSRSRSLRVIGRENGLSAPGVTPVFDDPTSEDSAWMKRALEQARAAERTHEVPVGAVLVRNGEVLEEAFNLTRTLSDPTAHAEMVAIRAAAAREGGGRLLHSTLYVTLEPCAMCAGAIVLARIGRLVYAASDPKTGMCGSLGTIVQDRRLNHHVRLTAGVCEDEAGELLRRFFRARR
jgi:tRNA(adenine34) deaminase